MSNQKDSKDESEQHCQVVVIGGGLTGLTTAFTLHKMGYTVKVLEKNDRIGGQIHTFQEKGYTFEGGPNTGVVSYPEVSELFSALSPACTLATAREAAKCRFIWKGQRFHALPSGLKEALATPLFSWKDKFRILGEPFRAPGKDPNESVAALTCRRLGKSYFKYAVDPFLSGVYAGDPTTLVTRFALPKLYNLEAEYGSFIRGAIAKARQPKTERDKLATKKVFSAQGGLSRLTDALAQGIEADDNTQSTNGSIRRIELSACGVSVRPLDKEITPPSDNETSDALRWQVSYTNAQGTPCKILCQWVVTTVGAYALPDILPFVDHTSMKTFTSLRYAPIVQVCVGIKNPHPSLRPAFGGLVPTCEHQPALGILFPSDCFEGRAPQGCSLYSFFLGGIRHPEVLNQTDEQLHTLVCKLLHDMLGFPFEAEPDVLRIFRHEKAIPQYEKSSEQRFAAIEVVQHMYPGLMIGGNIKGGIGMADRIRQAVNISVEIDEKMKEENR